MAGTVLILGGRGRFGRHAAAAFSFGGWQVRDFDRQTDSLWDAAWGADVIVNAFNPAYTDWPRDVPRFTKDIIQVARSTGATVIIPGNLYVYDASQNGPWGAETPHAPTTDLGRIRCEMEAAYRASGVRTIILRGGDFLDTMASGNWFDKIIVPNITKGRITYPGAVDQRHAWAWLPDMAEAAVCLANRRAKLEVFEDVAFVGYTLTGAELVAALSKAAARPLRVGSFPWWQLRLARRFWPMADPLLEMRYLWDLDHCLEGARFDALVPDFIHTDPAAALSLAIEPQLYPDKPVRTCLKDRFGKGAFCGPQDA